MNTDWLIKFLVKIDFKNSDNRASGIIVKLDNFKDDFFVFTAKHTFEDEKKNIIINKDEFSILYQNKQKIEFKEYILLDEDIVIFIFDNTLLKEIKEFDFTIISSRKNNFGKCVFRGYPKSQLDNGSLSEPSMYIQKKENSENLYQIRPDRKNTDTIDNSGLSHAKGFSGSGLFIEEQKKYALVGIIKEHEKNLSAYNYIALAPLMDEVIEKLSAKCNKVNSFKKIPINIPIIKNGKELGIITIKTVPVKMDDGRILNVSIYPVTFGEYDLFCEDKRNSKRINGYIDKERRKVLPVVNVTWEDAMDFCKWLNENTQNNKKYRLPSSKEWEIIAYQNKSLNDIYCDKKDFCMKIGTNRGVKGIFDFLGNIEEICSNKIVKGASFKKAFNTVLNFKRESEITNLPKDEVGFRIVRDKS